MQLRLLGPVEVLDAAGEPVDVGGPKERAVLAVLVLHAGEVVSEDALIDALWGEQPPRTATKTLQAYISRLRKALGSVPGVEVESRRPGYLLLADRAATDLAVVEGLFDTGRSARDRGDPSAAAAALREAERLWRGRSLGEFADEPFAVAEAVRLDGLRLLVLAERIDADLACGRHHELVGELEGLCAAHPLREQLWAQRMLALYRSGRQGDALGAYQELKQALADELGLDPSPELQELERRILGQDPTLGFDQAPTPSAGLPTGVVTFLLTDIEGSSALWEAHPAVMGAAVARHDVLAAAAIARHSGMLLKTRGEGDSTFSVFASVSHAAAAALDLQAALDAEPWPDQIAVRVRMSVHTGEAEVRDGDYFGPVCNRAARLRAVAHGGQVVCSQASAQLLEDRLPDGASLRRLGAHRLQDLARPETVYQLGHSSRPGEFPPLRSLESWPNNLPVQLTSFVGRVQELRDLRALLADHRLVTLTGSAGCGKTRLALQLGAECLQDHLDGVWFVDLAPLNDAELVMQTVATALGVRESPNPQAARSITDVVVDYLRPRALLLVLDNCEHLLDAAAELSDGLVRVCPQLRILATSREALGLAGEVSWRVRSLSVPGRASVSVAQLGEYEAVRLFVERGRACVPGFELTEADGGAVAQICRQLDGIPLAIELAASRVEALTPAELARRLDDRFQVLAGGTRRGLERHQTLRAAVDWSYDALSPAEQVLLARLSVFAGGCTLDAAEQVCSGGHVERGHILGLLSRLVAKSLVVMDRQSSPARYRLLETIRQYAWDKLDTDAASDLRSRHLTWCLDLTDQAARGVYSSRQMVWFDILEGEEDNIRQALEWTIARGEAEHALALTGALGRFWMVRRRVDEGLRWTLEALALDGAAQSYQRAQSLTSAALFLVGYYGAYAKAGELALASLDLFRALGIRRGMFWALHTVSLAALFAGDVETAVTYGEEALVVARDVNHPSTLAYGLLNRADVAIAEGAFSRVDDLLREALPLVRRLDDKIALVRLLGVQGYVAIRAADYPVAVAALEETVIRSGEIGDTSAVIWALTNLGCIALVTGDVASAHRCFQQARASSVETGFVKSSSDDPDSRTQRAEVHLPMSSPAWERPELEAERRFAPIGSAANTALLRGGGAGVESVFLDIFLLDGLAELALTEGDIARAASTFEQALVRLGTSGTVQVGATGAPAAVGSMTGTGSFAGAVAPEMITRQFGGLVPNSGSPLVGTGRFTADGPTVSGGLPPWRFGGLLAPAASMLGQGLPVPLRYGGTSGMPAAEYGVVGDLFPPAGDDDDRGGLLGPQTRQRSLVHPYPRSNQDGAGVDIAVSNQVLLPSLIAGVAKAAIAGGLVEVGVRLFGSAEHLRTSAISLHRQGRWTLAEHGLAARQAAARQALGDTAYEAAYADGEALSALDTLELVLATARTLSRNPTGQPEARPKPKSRPAKPS